MQSVMRSVVKCLAIASSIFLSTLAFGQEYIQGEGTLIKDAIADLKANAAEYYGVQVANHRKLTNDNGKYDYKETTVTDACVVVPLAEIELTHGDGFWTARIEASKVRPVESTWVEQNITVNNTYNAPTTYSRGYRRDETTTRTTRRRDVVGPSGRVVKTEKGRGRTTRVRRNWDGRSGYTWTSTRED